MGSKTLVYRQKVIDNLNEAYTHFSRLENAFLALEENYMFPISDIEFKYILDSRI